VPFLNGLTYAPIPRLLIPRFLDDEKGISHAGNVLLTVNYGVQTLEQTRTTSIGWGLVPEAYANFGYVGVAALALVLAIFYSWVTNISVGVPMTSLRFVLGLLIMAAAAMSDTMGIFVTSQFQGIVGVSLAALVLMRRQANPFAAEAANGGTKQEAEGKWGRKGPGALVGRWDDVAVGTSGMPAQGVTPAGQVAADGGVVRTMPIRTPKRIASWMPRRVRAAVIAQQQGGAEGGDLKLETGMGDGSASAQGGSGAARERPRQLAVPYQNYRRYRG
jgi:hypothetical protein